MKVTPGAQSLILAGEPMPPRVPATFPREAAMGPRDAAVAINNTHVAARAAMRVGPKLVSQQPIDVSATDADSEAWQSSGFEIQQYLSTRGSPGELAKGAHLDVRA
jgi:hypothetical protein